LALVAGARTRTRTRTTSSVQSMLLLTQITIHSLPVACITLTSPEPVRWNIGPVITGPLEHWAGRNDGAVMGRAGQEPGSGTPMRALG
jgi:hypothetical protein